MKKHGSWRPIAFASLGLVWLAFAFSSCGDSTADLPPGEITVSEGFFEGGTSGGGSIALKVGSIEKVFIRCGGEEIVSPDLDEPIGSDGSFFLQFSGGSRSVTLEGRFTSDSSVSGTLASAPTATSCDGSFGAERCASCTDNDGNGVPDDIETEPTPTPSLPTPTPTPSLPTPTPTTTTSTTTSSTTTTSTSSTTTTTGGGGGVPDLSGEYDVNSFRLDVTSCANPASNGNFSCSDFCSDFVSIEQAGEDFAVEFSLIDDETLDVDVAFEGTMSGQVGAGGEVSGTFSGVLFIDDEAVANVSGTFTGNLNGDVLSVSFSGSDSISGCSASGSFEGER